MDIISITINPSASSLLRESSLKDKQEVKAEFMSNVVIATGSFVYGRQLHNHQLRVKKWNALNKGCDQKRRQKQVGMGEGKIALRNGGSLLF